MINTHSTKWLDKPWDKTKGLFEIRRITQDCYFSGLRDKELRWFMSGLSAFQHSIYQLDLYGESVWEIDDAVLNAIWENVYQKVRFFGLSPTETTFLVRDIKKYQSVELGLRRGITPLKLNVRDFYHLKTCDVRLARTLIRVISDQQSTEPNVMDLWNCYDIISEVCDDMVDVTEDSLTYNCNRLLIEKDQFGVDQVYSSYSNLISIVQKEAAALIKNACRDVREFRQIYLWTETKANEAHSILRSLLEGYNINAIYNPSHESNGSPSKIRSVECLDRHNFLPPPFNEPLTVQHPL